MNNPEQEASRRQANQLRLAGDLLENFSDDLCNRGCNDWEFPDNWTEDDKKEFCRAYHEWNGDPSGYDEDRLFLHDWQVAGFMAYRLRLLAAYFRGSFVGDER